MIVFRGSGIIFFISVTLVTNVVSQGRTYDSYPDNMFSNQFMNRPINMFGQDGLNELDGLGESISSGVHNQLKPLDNLGQQIEQNVYQALEPVRALEVTSNMKSGVGGTTIITYLPSGKRFLIQNSAWSKCEGAIDDNTGQCSGRLVSYEGKDLKDNCYHRTSYSIINDNICLGANSVSIINDQIICRKADGSPAVLMKGEDFRRLCQGVADTAIYKYIANEQDMNHVPIPNPNRYVKCENNQPGVCVFREKLPFPASGASGGSIMVNNVYA
ncbi:unnamed protein product [Acanthoscelides obtectus]|uniref:Uncharacterized protein n=1 Tax=Acanthoscelides obtectus TaxID=200917 RepID=A0A9P0Q3T7_ACAOB|nr:unnamed protein product [Acanthoscelides obtectus]CAK1641590.1 hypothetical protein AOBTE_LOCUS12495 [Acanthoscelides obtectus]